MYKQRILFLLIPFLLFYALPVSAVKKEENKWHEELVYYLEIDRFNNGDVTNDGSDFNLNDPLGYHGGDLKGITNKLDYLQEMGFSTIILSPVFNAKDPTGEQVENFKEVDEHFGSLKDMQQLSKEAHEREMKVLMSFNAYHVQNLKDDLIDVVSWWVSESEIDGYYIDQVDTLEPDFWKLFIQTVKKENENLYLVGSILHNDHLSAYKELGFDSILNELFFKTSSETFTDVDLPFTSISEVVKNSSTAFSNYLDMTNTARFTLKATENAQHPGVRLKMALSYMYSTPGTPIVYYGTEIALNGGKPPENKPLMNFQSDEELIDYIAKLAKARKSLPSLTKGDYTVLYEKAGMIIFKRTYKGESVIVAMNNTSQSQNVSIPAEEIGNEKELRGLIIGDIFHEENRHYPFILDRETAEIYEIKEKTGLNLPFISVFLIVPLLFVAFLVVAYKRGKRNEE